MRADVNAGIKAEVNVSPTSSTIMAKRAAVSGVPNRAEKNAAMPLMVAVRRTQSLRCSSFPTFQPMLPPICKAAPSRPAEPPHRWVSTVPRKMAGTSSRLTGSPLCTARMTLLVPTPSHFVTL